MRPKACPSGKTVQNGAAVSVTGDYVLFVDSDDYIVPDAIETLYNTAKSNNADVVTGDLLNEKEIILYSKKIKDQSVNRNYIEEINGKAYAQIYSEIEINECIYNRRG